MVATRPGDIVRVTAQTDSRGIVGKEYMVIADRSGDPHASNTTLLFPDPPDGPTTDETGWTLRSTRGNTDWLRGIGIDPDLHSGWTFYGGTWELVGHADDPLGWYREHVLGETAVPTEFAQGNWVTHRDFAKPCQLVYRNPTTERWIVHAPAGSLHPRVGGESGQGWSIWGTNAAAEARTAVCAYIQPGFNMNDDRDGFRWVSEDACTLVSGPDGVAVAAVTVEDKTATVDIEFATITAGWDGCGGSHPEDQRRNRKHPIIGQEGEYLYLLEPFGSRTVNDRLPVAVKQKMKALGLPQHLAAVTTVSEHGVEQRHAATEAEMREEWPRFRGPIANPDHGPWGSLGCTIAVVVEGETKWMPGSYTTTDTVRVLSRERITGRNSRRTESYGSEYDVAIRWGFDRDRAIYSTPIPADEVRWLLPYVDLSLANDHLTAATGTDAKVEAIAAFTSLEERRANFVDVLTRGAKRLNIVEYLPEFFEKVGLSDDTQEYVISVPVEINGTVMVRQKVRASTFGQAMGMFRTPGRGEQTIQIPNNDRIRVAGIPTITG